MKLQELFKTAAADVKWTNRLGYTEARFATDTDELVTVQFEDVGNNESNIVDVEFFRNGKQRITGEGSAAKIMSMVYSIILDYLAQSPSTEYILFSAHEPSRVKLYRSMIDRLATSAGFESISINSVPGQEWSKHTERIFALKNAKLDENWRKGLAAAGIGAAMALGGYGLGKLVSKDQTSTTSITSGEVQSVDSGEESTKGAEQKYTVPGEINHTSPRRNLLIKYAVAAGINGTELSQLLAQVGHETGGFRSTSERGSSDYFKKYDIKHNPRLAKILGNLTPGDGAKYRGRGDIQLTGKANYQAANEFLKKYKHIVGDVDIVKNPDLVATDPKVGIMVTLWYWFKRVKPHVSDFGDTKRVTKLINSGLKGLEDREMRFAHEQRLGLRVRDHDRTLYTSHLDDTSPTKSTKLSASTSSLIKQPAGKKLTPVASKARPTEKPAKVGSGPNTTGKPAKTQPTKPVGNQPSKAPKRR